MHKKCTKELCTLHKVIFEYIPATNFIARLIPHIPENILKWTATMFFQTWNIVPSQHEYITAHDVKNMNDDNLLYMYYILMNLIILMTTLVQKTFTSLSTGFLYKDYSKQSKFL